MKLFSLLLLFPVLFACSTKKVEIAKEKECSPLAMSYLKNPKNKNKHFLSSPEVLTEMGKTGPGLQACYEDFKRRTGHEEFNTCLVVGVDQNSKTDFYHFYSSDKKVDEKFINCAVKATSSIPYFKLGKNYILIQTYEFYKD